MLQSKGSRLGPYEIEAPLGAGGMGEVYRARDTRLDRTVALKVLSTQLAVTPALRERFAREARAISAVEHPNICALYDVGAESGVDYIVMQFVEGETLAARLAHGPIPQSEAHQIARQIALALEAAHERGIVHRDLKPGNVQLTPDGQVKLLDFGLARILTPQAPGIDQTQAPTLPAPSQAGAVVGTAPYMSPEQARGQAVDKRADVWSFGCVLYEMLSGRRAFEGHSAPDVLAAVLNREPDWDRLPAATPWRVRELLRRCLRKDVTRRLRDMGDARLELEDVSAGGPEAPASARSPRASALLVWCVAGAAIALAALALARSRPTPAEPRAAMRFSAVTNLSGVEAQPSFSPDGRSIAYISNLGGQWDVYVGLVGGGNPVRITHDRNLELRPRWSRDGSRLLFARLNEAGLFDVWEAPSLGGAARRIVLNGMHPAWAADGRQVAYSSGGALWICDASGANPRAVTRREAPVAHHQPAFSHDGRSLAFVRRHSGPYGELAVADVGSGAVRDVTRDGALALLPVWSPDDRFIYFTSSRGGTMNVWKIPAASGEPQQITAGQGEDTDIDLSADGTRLVFSSFRVNVNLADMSLEPAASGRLRWLTTDSARGEAGARYSPDGRRIAYWSTRTGAERESIWVMDADGGNPNRLVESDRVNVYPRWASDGQHLLYLSWIPPSWGLRGELRRISLAGGPPQTLPIKGLWTAAWGDIAPDGRVLYRVYPDGGELYDPGTNQSQQVADLPGDPLWSRDGRSFAYATRPDSREPAAGLWTGTLGGPRRQVFRGWVTSFAWAGAGELLVVEGKPDLKGVLWRVDSDGRRRPTLSDLPLLFRGNSDAVIPFRFDAHPNGRRIVFEALESFEADISMIENVR